MMRPKHEVITMLLRQSSLTCKSSDPKYAKGTQQRQGVLILLTWPSGKMTRMAETCCHIQAIVYGGAVGPAGG